MEEGRNRGEDKRRKVRGNREGRETEKEPDDLSLIALDLHGKRRELSLARCPLTSAQAPGYMPLPHVCTHMHKIDKFKLHKKFKDARKTFYPSETRPGSPTDIQSPFVLAPASLCPTPL